MLELSNLYVCEQETNFAEYNVKISDFYITRMFNSDTHVTFNDKCIILPTVSKRVRVININKHPYVLVLRKNITDIYSYVAKENNFRRIGADLMLLYIYNDLNGIFFWSFVKGCLLYLNKGTIGEKRSKILEAPDINWTIVHDSGNPAIVFSENDKAYDFKKDTVSPPVLPPVLPPVFFRRPVIPTPLKISKVRCIDITNYKNQKYIHIFNGKSFITLNINSDRNFKFIAPFLLKNKSKVFIIDNDIKYPIALDGDIAASWWNNDYFYIKTRKATKIKDYANVYTKHHIFGKLCPKNVKYFSKSVRHYLLFILLCLNGSTKPCKFTFYIPLMVLFKYILPDAVFNRCYCCETRCECWL